MSVALMRPDQIVSSGLLDRAAPLTSADRAGYRAAWGRLRAENAPFRIVDADWHLVSAPMDVFDGQLLSHMTHIWQKAAKVVGLTMVESWNDVMQTWDFVLAARLHALAEVGAIESRGNLFEIRYSEVRLPREA